VQDEESDFNSLLVTSIAARTLAVLRGSDADLGRLGAVLRELASRGRLTRRSYAADSAVNLHHPGVAHRLIGSESFGGPELRWVSTDFAPTLLKRVLNIAELISTIEARGELLALADSVWAHIELRRLEVGTGRDLWDQPANAFPAVEVRFDLASWHHTFRVVECLAIAARLVSSTPLRSERLLHYASELLAEAEHQFDRELLDGSADSGPAISQRIEHTRQRLRRAREILDDRPGSAVAILITVLGELDMLVAARQSVGGLY
jgi:hypothetical protein